MFLGRGLERGGGRIGPGQKIVYLAVGMTVDDLGDDVDGTELAGLDQRGDDGPVLAAAV